MAIKRYTGRLSAEMLMRLIVMDNFKDVSFSDQSSDLCFERFLDRNVM